MSLPIHPDRVVIPETIAIGQPIRFTDGEAFADTYYGAKPGQRDRRGRFKKKGGGLRGGPLSTLEKAGLDSWGSKSRYRAIQMYLRDPRIFEERYGHEAFLPEVKAHAEAVVKAIRSRGRRAGGLPICTAPQICTRS
jgi:hypothetical protein